jgi:Zn-dependent peptidase ImmA (M78 family)
MNGKRDVWSAVEEFRAQYSIELGTLPVDVLTVIELRLKLDVIPFPDLFQKYSVDAAVLPDFSGIYVDERSYRFLEGKPIWLFNRLRFSLAHELGHIILHRDLVKDLKFTSLQVFRDWTQRCQQSRFSLEWEANEFGGRLLVPIDRLRKDFDTFVTRIQDQFPAWWTNSDLRSALADQLGEDYGVHKDVVSCRLDREDLWPSP